MIEARALCKLLDGMTISVDGSDVAVKNNMGNQDALDKFIAESDARQETKYPLVFVGLGDVFKELTEYKYVRSKIYILMITSESLLYKERSDKVYVPYIEPIYQEVKRIIVDSGLIIPIGERGEKFPYHDRPNYGIVKGEVGTIKQGESVTTDYVDARIIDIEYKIKSNCVS